jgi:polysaccharide pyruvyl transferase WcaK-like protein
LIDIDLPNSDQTDSDPDVITICLYVAIPEKEAAHPDIAPWPRRLKSLTRYSLDRFATRLSRRLHLDPYHYGAAQQLRDNSNRGDIAIRMAIRQQLTKAFAPNPVRFLEVKWGELTDFAAAEINACCDIFVIGGGGYMFLNADGTVGHMLEKIEELGKIRCPVFAYGIGLNRLMHERVCDLEGLPASVQQKIRYLSDKCELISVRDAETARLFALYSDKRVALTGDPVLSYQPEKPIVPVRDTERLTIGVNLAAHGWRALSILKPLLPAIVAFLEQVQCDAELVYLQHHELERPVIDFLHARGLKFKTVYGTPDDLLQAYANTDFVICQMLHASIFAAAAGKPFLNIAYDRKTPAFAELMGMPECCLSHSDAELGVLQNRFSALLQNRVSLGERLERRGKELRLAQTWFAERLAAHAQRLIWQDDFVAAPEMSEEPSEFSGTEIAAIVQQVRDTGAGLH